mgnify:CR=1 FL=1
MYFNKKKRGASVKIFIFLILGFLLAISLAVAPYPQPTLEVREFETIETKLTPFNELSEQKATVSISVTNYAPFGSGFTLIKPIYYAVKGSFDVKTDYPEPISIVENPAKSEYSWYIYLDGQNKGKWKEELKFDINSNKEPPLFIRESVISKGQVAKLERSGNFYLVKEPQIKVGDKIKFRINIQGNVKTWPAEYFPIVNGTETTAIYYKVLQAKLVLNLPTKYFQEFSVSGDYIKTKKIEPVIKGDNWVLTIPVEIGPYISRYIDVETTVAKAGDIEIDSLTVSFSYDADIYKYSTPFLGDFPIIRFVPIIIDGKFYIDHTFTIFQLKIPVDPALEVAGFDSAFVVRDDILADSVVAGTYAAIIGSPVFLVKSNVLSADVTELLLMAKGLGLKSLTIVGGPQAISEEIEAQLRELGFKVERIWGIDRKETSEKFALEKWGLSNTVVLVDAYDTSTQLIASSLASRLQAPLLLFSGDSLPTRTKATLTTLHTTKAILIYEGKPLENLEKQLQGFNIKVQSISGKDVIETSVKVGEEFTKFIIKPSTIFLVSESVPKLKRGIIPLAHVNLAPIFVFKGPELPEIIEGYIFDNDIKRIVTFGKIIRATEAY